MALQFNPYPYVDPSYKKRPDNPTADALQQTLQSWTAYKQQQDKDAQTQEALKQDRLFKILQLKSEGGDEAVDAYKQLGGVMPYAAAPTTDRQSLIGSLLNWHNNKATPGASVASPGTALAAQSTLPRTATSGMNFTPTERENAAQMSLPNEHPMIAPGIFAAAPPEPNMTPANAPASPSPTIQNATNAAAATAPAVAPVSSPAPTVPPHTSLASPQTPLDITPAHLAEIRKQKGSKGVKEYLDQAKREQDQGTAELTQAQKQNLIAQNTPYTPEQTRAQFLGYGLQGAKVAEALIAASPSGKIERSQVTNALSGLSGSGKVNALSGGLDLKTQIFNEGKWSDLGNKANLAAASGSSAFHAAAIGNQRADRALQVLNNPNATDQDLQNSIVDLQGIFQGGAPHEGAIGKAQYNNIQQKINEIRTFMTSTPQAANQPAIRQKIMDVVNEVKRVDNQVINNEMSYLEKQYAPFIQQDPQRWQAMKDAALLSVNSQGVGGGGGGPAIGEVRRGYKFKGGNPADQNSWEKI